MWTGVCVRAVPKLINAHLGPHCLFIHYIISLSRRLDISRLPTAGLNTLHACSLALAVLLCVLFVTYNKITFLLDKVFKAPAVPATIS